MTTDAVPYDVAVITDAESLEGVVRRAGAAEAIAVDVEANGLFVYRPRLCTVQIAWEEDSRTRVAIVDTLVVPALGLAPLFGPQGPIAVLHDLTFDARMLSEHGAPLTRARDTSVAARLLGQKATGLSSVLAAELGVSLNKRFQQHDWSERPLGAPELRYLGDDVAYLLALDRALSARIEAMDITAELEDEYAHKLRAALAPPRDSRPMYVRVKGAQKLDPQGRAALLRLVAARESAAEAADVPPFKIVTNEILLELARIRPTSIHALGRIRGALSGRSGKLATRWIEAITLGIKDGDIPAEDRIYFEPPQMDRREIARRREIEAKISAFRRAEAKRRGVDEQVVLPGHCAHDLASVLVSAAPLDPTTEAKIAAIQGLGKKRFRLYARAFVELLDTPKTAEKNHPVADEGAREEP